VARFDEPEAEDLARRPRPVTDQTRADVERLFAAGLGRNEIARELEISAGTVSKVAKSLGLLFNREQTALAVAARQVDLAEMRARLEKKLLVRADEALEAMDQPYLLGSFGGKENVWNETLLDEAPVEVKRNLMTIAGIGVQRAAELGRRTTAGEQLGVAESLADSIDAALIEWARQQVDLSDQAESDAP
jgi:hypothetical protein